MKNPLKDLTALKANSDIHGNTVIAMQQCFNGVPVHGGTIRVQFDKSSTITRISNKYQPELDIDTEPKINADKAVEIAINDMKKGKLDETVPVTLKIFEYEEKWYLAWILRIVNYENKELTINKYFIDAINGNIILKHNDLKAMPDSTGSGTGYYSGSGNIRTFKDGNNYKLIDNSRVASGGPSIRVCDCDGLFIDPTNSNISLDSDNNWKNSASSPRKLHQGPEVDALRFLGQVVDYFKNTHNWNSFDNHGSPLYAGVHYGDNENNGYWIGTGIVFGDGDGSLLDYTNTLDFAAHEFTHGVTDYTANLDYFNQAGGLNESFSDIFAVMVDRGDFLIFEDCTTPTIAGDAGRIMNNPSDVNAVWRQPNHFLSSLDSMNTGYFNGQDPHYSSGFVNYACYLMCNGGTHPNSGISVVGIGREKIEKIFFHALSIGLLGNNNATFIECREACLNAVDLIYKNDPEYLRILDTVKNAFTAVGIGPDIFVRDSLTDTGIIPSVGTLYLSPDIIVRNNLVENPKEEFADLSDDTLCENVEIGQDNYIYVRLQNRGSVSGSSAVKVYWTDPSSFNNPSTWKIIGAAGIFDLAPGKTFVTAPIKWEASNLPPLGHFCIVAELDSTDDPSPDKSIITTGEMYNKFISQSNNFAWRNVNVVDIIEGGVVELDFYLQAPTNAEKGDLRLDMTDIPKNSKIKFKILKRLTVGVEFEGVKLEKSESRYNYYTIDANKVSYIRNIPFKPSDKSNVRIYIKFPDNTSGKLQTFCSQLFGGKQSASITHVINLLNGASFEYIVNRNSGEIHKKGCEWVDKMAKANMVGYHTLQYAHINGYDNCAFCLGESKR
ncbi:M4 family metallopeptidase [Pseudobacteroides cellulosolvens]|uniref:Thermolysin n=2 Tax=Pseudobacteroides cellulosolvens TaxID=35825 RepID=A0A0L6JX58_9FIRM|nr:M4 family metallopeptidase [Pseudobacteroides cellulosolvens]KNY30438.1 Thermolysin [Pseudobacteroides cellulosolvens ATCC 35603 = DSM 2933]